jgi:DNA-binding beta-propeller fold protein YncE
MKEILFCAALIAFGCDSPTDQNTAVTADMNAATGTTESAATGPLKRSAYNFTKPSASYTMPPELAEISGIAFAGPERLAAIEDETGTLYFYNLRTERVDSTVKFGKKGDYEDVTRMGDAWLIIRSDGTLFRRTATETTTHATGLTTANDLEGLTYDAASRTLLVACKNEAGAGLDNTKRALYCLDLTTFKAESKPAYVLDVPQILDADPGQQKGKKDPKVSQFAPSAVAVHPQTGNIFVLSARGNGLVELNAAGKLVAVQTLPSKLFPQPEGLAFAPNGDLYISSEAGKKSGQGLIHRFESTGPVE